MMNTLSFTIRWLAPLLVILYPLHSMAATIDVTQASRMTLTEQVEWCSSDAALGVAAVATGGCTFKPASDADMAHGFSAQAYWLRLELSNPGKEKIERWLQVGHPRLQQVSLFETDAGGTWHRTDTGILTPVSQRPIVSSALVLPLALEAGSIRTFYVRVASQTVADITPTLWTPDSFLVTHNRVDMVQTLNIGGLLVTAFLCLLFFFRQRERVYLYFCGKVLAVIILEASLSGLLPLYLWPADKPYDIRTQSVAICMIGVFAVLFMRSFVGSMKRYRSYYFALTSSVSLLALVTLWACLVDYRMAMQVIWFPVALLFLGIAALLFRFWFDGSRAVGYLVPGIFVFGLIEYYRFATSVGISDTPDSLSFIYTWYFLFVTPSFLAGIALRSDTLRDELRQARADSNARMKFFARMSHEFRTPLNTVLGYAELLKRGSGRVSVPDAANAIKHSGRHLLQMIDDILDHVRAESGQLTLRPEPVHWTSFIQSLKRNAAMMPARGNHFQLNLKGNMP